MRKARRGDVAFSPIPLPFSLPPYPLPLSTPATQATANAPSFFRYGGAQLSWCIKTRASLCIDPTVQARQEHMNISQLFMKEKEKSFRCFWIPGSSYVTPYNCPYGEAPPEKGTFLRHQVYERVGKSTSSPGRSSLAREKRPGDEVVGKSVIFLCKKAQKRANRCILWL